MLTERRMPLAARQTPATSGLADPEVRQSGCCRWDEAAPHSQRTGGAPASWFL